MTIIALWLSTMTRCVTFFLELVTFVVHAGACMYGVCFGKSYLEVFAKTLPIEVGVCNENKTYYFSFWDHFKVIEGQGSSRWVHGNILNGVTNLLLGDFREDF